MLFRSVIHLGFSHDFSRYNEAVETDLAAVKAIGAALAGTGKPFVSTGGTLWMSGLGRVATEGDTSPESAPRAESEEEVISLAAKGVRSSVVRLAPCVHDVNRHGLASILGEIAADKGISAYIGEGSNVWPAVHRRDVAHLYCLALASAPAGTRLNGIAEKGIPMREIAATIGRHLNLPVTSLYGDTAQAHFGFFAQAVSSDNPVSSHITRKLLNWTPAHATLLQDMDSFYMNQM